MKVTLQSNPGQAPVSRRAGRNIASTLLAGFCGMLLAAGISRAESFSNFEAVDANGVSTWNGSFPIVLTGVLLTDPGEMLDAAPDFIPWDDGAGLWQLGGQWQVFVQAIGGGDRGGVECWMAQNYGNLPWIRNSEDSYANNAWTSEANRVSHDLPPGLNLQGLADDCGG